MKLNNGFLPGKLLAVMVGFWLMPMIPAQGADNMRFHGALVAEPCVIAPGAEAIQVDFGTVLEKYLYLNTRTLGQRFVVPLTGCDISLGNMVKITFTGEESIALPGLLTLNSTSQATGIAIGIETLEGEPIPLNKASSSNRLVDGDNPIRLKAYVQAEPDALGQQTIQRGPFSAVVTFSLEYE